MNCQALPYMGNQCKASFISAVRDDRIAWPFIERLVKRGLRIWHDADIRRPEADYSRKDRLQLAKCRAHVILLTEAATVSHVFRERYTFAIESGKPTIVITDLVKSQLSPAMRLQLNKAEAVFQIGELPPEQLPEDLTKIEALKACLGEANEAMQPQPYAEDSGKREPPSSRRFFVPSEATIFDIIGEERPSPSFHTQEPLHSGCQGARESGRTASDGRNHPSRKEGQLTQPGSTEESRNSPEVPGEGKPDLSPSVQAGQDMEKTIRLNDPLKKEDDLEKTVSPYHVSLPVVVSFATGERIRGMNGETTVGKKRVGQGDAADVSLQDSCPLFSRKHFQIICVDGTSTLICLHPNGLRLNGLTDLHMNEKQRWEELAIVQVPSLKTLEMYQDKSAPAFFAIAAYETADMLWHSESLAFLQSGKTGEIRWFLQQFAFGRRNAWQTGAMKSRCISRDHGEIQFENGQYLFLDHSSNGTVISGKTIHQESIPLKDGDTIEIAGNDQPDFQGESFLFRAALLRNR